MTTATPDAMKRLLARALEAHIPLSVLFELTNRCNHDCRHCYVDHDDANSELATGSVLRVLEELREKLRQGTQPDE